jgi:hypothetical protein
MSKVNIKSIRVVVSKCNGYVVSVSVYVIQLCNDDPAPPPLSQPLTMVSSLLADALTDPTAVLHDLFQSSNNIDGFPETVSSHFSQVFSSLDAFKEVQSRSNHRP